MIKSKKFVGSSNSKNEIVGEVASGGYSSTFTFFDHLFEETKIRIHNKQNLFFILVIFINAIFKQIVKKFNIR